MQERTSDATTQSTIIDDDTWALFMHGTGGEDFLSQGWFMQKNAFPFAGSIIHEGEMPYYQVSYRWQLPDLMRFNTKIRSPWSMAMRII